MRWGGGGGLESGLCTYTILSACRLRRPFRRFASRLEILQFFPFWLSAETSSAWSPGQEMFGNVTPTRRRSVRALAFSGQWQLIAGTELTEKNKIKLDFLNFSDSA